MTKLFMRHVEFVERNPLASFAYGAITASILVYGLLH